MSTQAYDKFKVLLAELFMFDQADLDFGIYRIMNAKRDEITRFLDNDLLPQINVALGTLDLSRRADLSTLGSVRASFAEQDSPTFDIFRILENSSENSRISVRSSSVQTIVPNHLEPNRKSPITQSFSEDSAIWEI
jgi:hypothetical protein